MVYGYARVSTLGQSKYGNSLEYQQGVLREHGAEVVYWDSFTALRADMPQFKKLTATLAPGDTLVVTKLDRMARSLSQGASTIDGLINRGIKVNILNIGTLDNTPASRLIRNIFLSFAEFEREMIAERCQEGRAIARQNPDYKEGRPQKFTDRQLRHALGLLEHHSYNQVESMTKISKSTLQRAKRRLK